MTKDSAVLSIDFIVGFTVFLLAFIWVLSMIPGMLIGLQAYTIDYDAVAYRTGVILVEDPGAPADPGWPVVRPRTDPWEFKTDKRDVYRLGLAISRDTPNILSENKVNRFFDRSLLNTTVDYRSKIIFGDYPYSFNISLLDPGQNRSAGSGIPTNSSYGYIQRFVKIKGASNATINESFIVAKGYLSNPADKNTTWTHVFSVLINNTKLHENATDPLYVIDPESERIVINLTDLNSAAVNKEARSITLSRISVLNNVPISTFPGIVIATNNYIQPLPAYNVENVTLKFSPEFFKTIYDSQGDIPLYVNLTFDLSPSPGTFLNSSLTGPYEYNYTAGNNVMHPQLRDGVLEVAIWSGETTSMVSHIITSSAGVGGTISPPGGSGGSVNVAEGDTPTFTILPDLAAGYSVSDVLVNGTSQGAITSYTFAPVHTNIQTISATFVKVAPAITSVSPTNGPMAGGTTVTITGTALTGATAVMFGATAGTILTNTATQITVTSPAHAVGLVDVRVTTPGGTSPVVAADQFTYNAAPTVTLVSPNSGPAAGVTTVTITGTGFTGATAVMFGGTAAMSFTVNSATSITATSPAGSGTVDVRVTTPSGTSAIVVADRFTYTGVVPAVTSIAPASGPAGGGTIVTITGTGFTSASTVRFGVTAGTGVTFISATQITVTSPAHAAGIVDVTVTTIGGTSPIVAGDQFTYIAAPTVTLVSPNSGPAAGGTTVTITGTGFTGATAVRFDGIDATSFTVNSATSITAVSPPHATANNMHITVTTPGGTSATSNNDRFSFT